MNKILTFGILALILSSQSLFAQKSKMYPVAKVPEELITSDSQILLCVFADLDEKQLLEGSLADYYAGNYELIDYDAYINNEKYKDLSKYRFVLVWDMSYGESEAFYGDDTYYMQWAIIDREIELRCLYSGNAYKKPALEFYLKRIEKKRAKANK